MAALPREIVNALLLGPGADGRLVHDSPIRGDVWAELAARPQERIDVLIEAHRDTPTGLVAARLARRLYRGREDGSLSTPADDLGFGVSYVEGFITAQVGLGELIRCVLPFTRWAADVRGGADIDSIARGVGDRIARQLSALGESGARYGPPSEVDPRIERIVPTFRMLAGISWALRQDVALHTLKAFVAEPHVTQIARRAEQLAEWILLNRPGRAEPNGRQERHELDEADIFAVSRNRPVEMALERSIPAIKADAVSTLFAVSCAKIGWAVLDTGIDETHPSFKDLSKPGRSRIAATFDFTRLRHVILVDHLFNPGLLARNAQTSAAAISEPDVPRVADDLRNLAEDARRERPINWSIAERYVKVLNPTRPRDPHGTHVAGILGGYWDPSDYDPSAPPVARRGVCTDIRLYDFRVVANSQDDTEFAVIGALQFIRHLNSRNNHPQIHGANISLSIRHDVRNYACGRTPVCEEAERAVHAGVVVVAAAGNRGYQSYHLSDGNAFETYAPSSITDPGNAEGVITVGSTHRSSPHSYGVSFFSSRGPTGDGRTKPDLVAPGEKIWSVVPGGTEDALSGTSMAAPHVSGAAALLMARNPEFIGQSTTIKSILCKTCTDLGRERTFQGAGMLDILRAMQSI